MFPRAQQEQLNRNVENKYNKPLPPSHNGNFGQSKQVFVSKAGFHSDFHNMLQCDTMCYNMTLTSALGEMIKTHNNKRRKNSKKNLMRMYILHRARIFWAIAVSHLFSSLHWARSPLSRFMRKEWWFFCICYPVTRECWLFSPIVWKLSTVLRIFCPPAQFRRLCPKWCSLGSLHKWAPPLSVTGWIGFRVQVCDHLHYYHQYDHFAICRYNVHSAMCNVQCAHHYDLANRQIFDPTWWGL